jgi:hypothetical protein
MLPTIVCPGSSQWPRWQRWGRLSVCVRPVERTRLPSTSTVTTITLAALELMTSYGRGPPPEVQDTTPRNLLMAAQRFNNFRSKALAHPARAPRFAILSL